MNMRLGKERGSNHLPKPPTFIDTSLNYGREVVRALCYQAADLQGDVQIVVDLGAGKGADLMSARRAFPGAQLHGVDVYQPNVKTLREAGFIVHELNLETDPLPFEDESIDVIISNQVLEHTKELFWSLHEVSRSLRVGGTLITGTPNLASLHNRILLLAGRQPSSINNSSAHLRGFTRSDLVALMNTGAPGSYELIASRGSNFYPLPRSAAIRAARLWPTLSWAIFLMFRKVAGYERGFLDWPVHEDLETNFFLG